MLYKCLRGHCILCTPHTTHTDHISHYNISYYIILSNHPSVSTTFGQTFVCIFYLSAPAEEERQEVQEEAHCSASMQMTRMDVCSCHEDRSSSIMSSCPWTCWDQVRRILTQHFYLGRKMKRPEKNTWLSKKNEDDEQGI